MAADGVVDGCADLFAHDLWLPAFRKADGGRRQLGNGAT
jgi:hypothetical protein